MTTYEQFEALVVIGNGIEDESESYSLDETGETFDPVYEQFYSEVEE